MSLDNSLRDEHRAKLCSARISTEAQNGMVTQILKDRLFNTPLTGTLDPQAAKLAVQGAL